MPSLETSVMFSPGVGWLPVALFQIMVVICNLSRGLGVFRKVEQTNGSSSPYLLQLIWAPLEHLKWTVQQLTQEAHSVSAVPAVSIGPRRIKERAGG